MGKHVAWTGALILESLTKLINLAGSLTPGNVGIYEGGTMVIAGFFGLSGTVGLTLGLCRRLRGIFWALCGILSFLLASRTVGHRNESGSSGSSSQKRQLPPGETLSQSSCEFPKTTAAIIFIEDYHDARGFTPELAHVGTLPIVLRAILQAQSANVNRIIVAANRMAGNVIRRELLRTRRLPETVEWFEMDGGYRSLPRLIAEVAASSDRIFLLPGGMTCHPCLYQVISEWDGQGEALALTTGGQLLGIAALSHQGALDIARDCPSYVETPLELYAWFKPRHSVAFKEVAGELWQAVNTPSDRLIAERKLDEWLVKPTDGLFARMNRRISIPISRQLIKFPITPNMVTLFTLGVSFLAGVFFALGGYWYTVIGALLSVWASILDGCDGEVARLKLQVSNFGCWLETICDYLYYLFIFVGMSIGLTRSRGTEAYLVWGGALIIGAVVSFSGGRRGAASVCLQPSREVPGFVAKESGQTETEPADVHRAPDGVYYPSLFSPLCSSGVRSSEHNARLAFIATAIGANLVWIIALYSYRVISTRSPVVSSPAIKKRRRECVSGTALARSWGTH